MKYLLKVHLREHTHFVFYNAYFSSTQLSTKIHMRLKKAYIKRIMLSSRLLRAMFSNCIVKFKHCRSLFIVLRLGRLSSSNSTLIIHQIWSKNLWSHILCTIFYLHHMHQIQHASCIHLLITERYEVVRSLQYVVQSSTTLEAACEC